MFPHNTMRRSVAAYPPRLLAAALLTLAVAATTAAAPADNTLAADALVARVLAENAGLAALRSAVDAARARIAPAGALPDPQVSVDLAPETIGSYNTPANVDDDTRISWSVSQAFPWPGTLGLRAQAAREQAAAANAGASALRLQLAAATRGLYAEWCYVHQALVINHTSQDLVDELREVAAQRYAAGLGRQQDVLKAELERRRIERQALVLERRKRALRARINALRNRDVNAALAPPQALPAPQPPPAYAALQAQALAGHPELVQIRHRIGANKDREALANKAFYPDFKVFGGSRSGMDPSEKRLYVGVGLSLPLSWGKYRAGLDAAKADTMRLKYELTDRRAQLLGQLEQARAAVTEARDSIALYEDEIVPLARANLRAARADYGSGGGAFLDVIDAEQSALAAGQNLARARADYFAAHAELQRWSGGPLPAANGLNDRPTGGMHP